MSKTMIAAVIAATLAAGSTAFAGGPEPMPQQPAPQTFAGTYVGVQGGVDWVNANKLDASPILVMQPKSKTGFVYRVFAGYQFNRYIAAEAGFMQYHSYKVVTSSAFLPNVPPTTTKRRMYAFDAMAKAMYPVSDQFYAFGKAGIAYVNFKFKGAPSSDFVRPKLAAGVGYKVAKNVDAEVSYSHTFGRGKPVDLNTYVPGLNTVMVGAAYTF